MACAGFAIAVSGQDREIANHVFLSGWFVAAFAAVARFFLRELSTPMARPLKVVAVGFAAAAISGLPGFFGGESVGWLFYAGLATMAAGIVWAVGEVNRRRQ